MRHHPKAALIKCNAFGGKKNTFYSGSVANGTLALSRPNHFFEVWAEFVSPDNGKEWRGHL